MGRVPRLRLTPFSQLDNPVQDSLRIQMADLALLYQKASLPVTTQAAEKEKQQYQEALFETSTHYCDNAFFQVDFGLNPLGVTLGTPSDQMHLFKSGSMKQVIKSLMGSMFTNV